jgi:hypothetical protein
MLLDKIAGMWLFGAGFLIGVLGKYRID